MGTWTKSLWRALGLPGCVAAAKVLFSDEVPIYLTGARIKSMLLLLAFILLTIRPAAAQFNTPTVDGVIGSGEYGTHTDGNNQQNNSGTVWYMTWDATNLYIGISGANVAEGAVIYIDGNPIAPINGGTNADGTLVGQNYDGTSFAALQFRADHVSYFKDGYREHRTADASNGWSGATTFSGSYFSNGSNVREYSIPWSNITSGGIPSSFNWFGYVTSSGGFVYGETPAENGSGTIGTSAREQRYFTVSATTNGSSTKPFARNSYVFNSATDLTGFGGVSVYDFTMNSSGRQIFRSTDASTWTIGGNLRVDAGTIHFDNTTGAATVSGNVFIGSSGTLNLGNVIGGDLNLAGNWTNNGTFNHNSRRVTFNGTGTQTISGSSTTNFGFLTVNMGTSNSNVLDVQSVIALVGSPNPLTITNGTFKLSSNSTLTPFTSSAGAIIPATGGFWVNGGAVSTGGFSWELRGLLRVTTGTLTVGTISGNSINYFTGSTITIEGGALSVAGRLGRDSGAAGNTTTYTQTGGTVTVVTVGSGLSSRAGFDIGASGSSFTMSNGTIAVQRATSNTTGDYLNLATTNNVTGGTLQIGNSNSPDAAVIRINSTAPVYHLTVNNSTTNSTKPTAQLVTNNLTVKGDITVQSSTTLDANNLNINLAGNWSNSGTFTPGTGTVTLDGANPQTMSGSTFNNLTINNASGVTLLTDETVSNTLTLTSGNVTTGSNKMIIAPGGSVSRTSGHVVGNLQKNFATGSNVTRTYEVGTGSDYTPVNVTIASVSTAGNVTAKSTAGDHADISSSNLDAAKSVNRNWTLTKDGSLAFTTYDATFNFVSSDLDGSTNTNNLSVGKFDAGTWTYPTVGTRTATSTQATGMTSFSDFQLAEAAGSITDLAAGNQTACSPATNTYTQEVIVTFTNAPGSGTLDVNGQQFAIGASPQTVTLTGLIAGGNPVDVTASFSANPSCALTENALFTAPANCQCISPPTANAGADLSTTTGVSAKIGANPTASGGTGTLTINWSPSAGLGSTSAANPTATPSSTTTYTVTVTDANNCVATDQVTVRVANLVNSRIKAVIGPTNLYDSGLNQVRVDIGIKNISGAPIYGPLTTVFKTLTPGPPTITIPNADGGGEGLGCYYDYSNLLGGDNILSPGETSGYKLWIFQEHVTPAVSFRFFADVVGDLDGVPKVAADDQPLALAFDLQNGAVQDHFVSTFADKAAEIPKTYALHHNHPNPFNPSTAIQLDLPEAGEVTLKIYNSVGQLVRTLVSSEYEAGAHKVIWDARNDRGEQVTSGVYLAVFKAGEVKQVRRGC